jgi:hypothetical protein
MSEEQLERIWYMAQTAKEAGIMLVIAPEAILDLMDTLKASIELTAIREQQLKEERNEVERLRETFVAASSVLDVMERGGEGRALEKAMNQLAEAVARAKGA